MHIERARRRCLQPSREGETGTGRRSRHERNMSLCTYINAARSARGLSQYPIQLPVDENRVSCFDEARLIVRKNTAIATMKATMLYLAVVLLSWCSAAPDKLMLDTKAPPHARSSSAARALSGQTPANVGRLPQQSKPPAPSSAGQRQQDDVQREETVSFKEVNGETVRSVVGNYAYQSPEGLPVSFKYMADENGNQASFTIGAAAGGSGSKSRPGGGTGGSPRPGGAGAGKTGAGAGKTGVGGGGAGTKGNQSGKNAIGGDGDRKYLPPN